MEVTVEGDKKKEVTWSELATTLLTMTRKTGPSGTQATTRRRCYLRKIARHTQSAPPAHTGSKEQQDKQGYIWCRCTAVGTVRKCSPEVLMATYGPYRTAQGDRNGK
jgi:hypothetical protein